jgi:hypothetical protein
LIKISVNAKKPTVSKAQKVLYDKPFNPHRIATSDAAKSLVGEMLHYLSSLEKHRQDMGWKLARKRGRKTLDRNRYERQVEALVSDVAVHHLTGTGSWLRVPRRKQDLGSSSNYKPAYITEKFVDVMDSLALPEVGFIAIDLGSRDENPFANNRSQAIGKQTRIRATQRLIDRIEQRNLKPSDFSLDPAEEVIHLKGKKQGESFWATAGLIPYQDTDKTRQMREDLRRINEWLDKADIELGTDHPTVDLTQRRLHRLFNEGSWESHGRFYGGFWITLPKEIRRDILIDGELTADLDFGQMNPRLLYAEVGVRPSFEDAYAVPGFEAHREGVKKLLNSLIAAPKPLGRYPKDVKRFLPPLIDIGGEKHILNKIQVAVDLISDFHRPIAQMFCKGISNRLMYKESEIMNKTLLSLVEEGITALPIHDGMLVAQSKAERARDVMLKAFKDTTGFEGVVSINYD